VLLAELLAGKNNMENLNRAAPDELMAAIAADDPVSGHTHSFYRYPARFSPLFVREVIRQFSRPGEVVLDPFMGGGTTIVEALAQGRKAIGIDLNSLAHFVSTVKTTPLSVPDVNLLEECVRAGAKIDHIAPRWRRDVAE
jgi:hypothetical protein